MRSESSGSPACPDPEELAAFVDRRLPGVASGPVERHLADCDPCRELVADAARLSRERLSRRGWTRPRAAVATAGVALALAASLVLIVRVAPDLLPFEGSDAHAELVAAVAGHRTVEARLTGGFAFGPLRPVMRSASARQSDEDFRVLAVAGALAQRAEARPSPANRHAAGVAHLVIGEHDRAVATLEAAVSEEPSRAAYHSDLAAAYIARGRDLDRPEDFVNARVAAERAIGLDVNLGEAYFNRALALEALGEAREAEQAYRQALALDPHSPWNAEIQARLQHLLRR